ncbi:hypothetical protein BP00DRAFT_468675 [Aspergillus indologenus CBS 114.80]|uniref:NACHT domain-containing protein n=1 Tax=Aspergillus indologenus CBS 114.80 TaxID=1450541 RepID=A0A2V5IF27_9EURO|nr:hypothetical protein BP00DRAFT_468675 [Aspergillus indologenus CBS 114.80]
MGEASDALHTKHDKLHRLQRPFSWMKNRLRANQSKGSRVSAAATPPTQINTPDAPSSSRPVSGQSMRTDRNGNGQSHSTASDAQSPETNTQAQPDLWQKALQEAQNSTDWKSHQKEYDEAIRKCKEVNQKVLQGNSNSGSTNLPEAMSSHLNSLREQIQERQWGYKDSHGKTIYFRDVVTRIVNWVGVFKDPGNQLAGLDPTKAASLVWGFMQFFVERAVVYSEIRDLAIDQEPIASLLGRYALIEHLHLNNNPGGADCVYDEVRKKIVMLYTSVILYQLATFRNLLHNILKTTEPITRIGSQLKLVLDVVVNIDERKHSDVLKWVSPILHMDHHRAIRPMKGTGVWLLSHPDWLEWRQSQKSGLFWLRGKMGAGKSNLVSTVISYLQEASLNDEEHVAYFYANRTTRAEETKSAETALRSLLKQLASQGCKALLQQVVAKYDETHDHSSLSKEDCVDLLRGIISEFRQTNIIIDGFDELEDDDVRSELLEALKEVSNGSQGSVVKILISSRDHVQIGDLLKEGWVSWKEILVGDKNHQDIERFIDRRLLDLQKRLHEPIPEYIKHELEALLKERSNGMFLWVHLSLKYLVNTNAKDPATFLEELKSVPSQLEQAYTTLYETSLQGQSQGRTFTIRLILSLLMYGCQDEIFKRLAFLSAINYRRSSDLSAETLLALCSPFVELDPNTENFQLIHLSVKEFLQSLPEYESMAGHAFLATHCLSYLNEQPRFKFYVRGHSSATDLGYWFDNYTAESWVLHTAKAGSLRQSLPLKQTLTKFWPREGHIEASTFKSWVDSVTTFKYRTNVLRPIISGAHKSLVLDSKPTTFFLACQYDLREEVEKHLSEGWDINTAVERVGTGLSFACFGNQVELASYLLSRGAKIVLEDKLHPDSPIFAAINSPNPKILELMLHHGAKMALQPALESALHGKDPVTLFDRPFLLSPRHKKQRVKMLLDYSSDFEYSSAVQQGIFKSGTGLLQLRLERNPSFCVTSETLERLFKSWILPSEIKSHIKSLIPLNSRLVASESFLIALKWYKNDLRGYEGDESPLDVLKYILSDLNPCDSSVAVCEAALRAAIRNDVNGCLFTEFLLQTNPSMEISNDLNLWAIEASRSPVEIIGLLTRHGTAVRSFSRSDVKAALEHVSDVSGITAALLRSSPGLDVDQEVFTRAASQYRVQPEDLWLLFTRATDISLTGELIDGILTDASDQIVSEVVLSSIPEQITNELLTIALGNRYICGTGDYGHDYKPPRLTMVQLLSRAPDTLELSEETLYLVCKSTHWIMEQVFRRWPNVHLSQRAVDATVDDLRRFRTLVKERPSIKVSTEAITSLCNSWRNPNLVDTLKEILIFQPGVIITEEMFLAATEYSEACVTEVLARSRNTILGENEMCDVVKTGSPRSLGVILSQRPDAVVTENVVKYLMDGIKADKGAENFLGRWRYEFENEAFDMLLERSGLIDLKRQMLKSEVRKLIWD